MFQTLEQLQISEMLLLATGKLFPSEETGLIYFKTPPLLHVWCSSVPTPLPPPSPSKGLGLMQSQRLSRFFILLKLARSKSQLMEAEVGWGDGGNRCAGHVLFQSQLHAGEWG